MASAPYPPHLSTSPSPLHKHVAAQDCLIQWLSTTVCLVVSGLLTVDMNQLRNMISFAYADGTLETYGSGLLLWHIFCDRPCIPEDQRCPAPAVLVFSFIATLAESYAGGTISGYVAGVRAWHVIHGALWVMKDNKLDVLLRAADTLTPESSKQKKRLPYTILVIEALLFHLDLSVPHNAAVAACLLMTFYSAARLGEFMVQTLTSFDPKFHVKPSDLEMVTVIHCPVFLLGS